MSDPNASEMTTSAEPPAEISPVSYTHLDVYKRQALGDPTVLGGGAHEPTPTPYWILDDLLGGLSFERTDHLLDVGCGAGDVYKRQA